MPSGWDGRGDVGYNQDGYQWPAGADNYNVSVSSDGAEAVAARPEMRPQSVSRPRVEVRTNAAIGGRRAGKDKVERSVSAASKPASMPQRRPVTARVLGPTWW